MAEDYHYKVYMNDGSTKNEGDVNCTDAEITLEGHFPFAVPTYTADSIRCDTTATISASGSSTINIGALYAASVKITCHSSATIIINYIEANSVAIEVVDSAKVRLEDGTLANITGVVQNGSNACFAGTLSGSDDVQVSGASTWSADSCPIF